MATSTQLAQALALKKQNPNLSTRDAVLQTKQATTPTPAPTPTPATPTQTPIQQPIAKAGDAVIGVNGERFVQANNYDGSTNVTGAPSVVNQSGGAVSQMQEIQALSTAKRYANQQANPIAPMTPIDERTAPLPTGSQTIVDNAPNKAPATVISQPTAPNTGANKETIDPVLAQSQEDARNGVFRAPEYYDKIRNGINPTPPPNSETIFGLIANKQPVQDELRLTPAYKQAQNRYNRVNMYSSMTPSQVSTAMDGGKIIEGSQTWEDLKIQNPKLAQDVQNLRIVNGSKTNIYTVNPDGTKTNNLQKTYEEQFMEDYSDLFKVQTVADIIAQVKTADVVEAETKANQYEDEMNALEADIAKIDADVDAELKGSGATGSRARLEKSVRRAKLTDELTALNKLYTTQANRANQLITQNATALQTQMSQQQARSSAVAGVMMKGYENQMALNQEQALFDQKIAQQAQAMNDPYQAIPAMVDEYKKLGIPFTRSTQQIIQDFEGSGQDLATYLSDLQKTIQSKPEYQKMQALQMGQLSDAEKLKMGYQFDLSKMGLQEQISNRADIRNFEQQKEIAKLNNDYNRQDFLFQLENDPAKRLAMVELEEKLSSNKSLFDVLGKNVGTYEGNRGYDLAGKLGDPMPAGGNWTVKSVDTAGELGVPYKAGTKKPYGNTVVMVDENGNEVRYSHLESIGVKPGDTLGFGDIVGTRGNTGNVRGANGETLTAEQLQSGRGAHLDIEIKDSSGKLLSQQEQVNWLKSKKAGDTSSLTDKQFTQYNQMYSKFNSDPNVKAFESALAGGGDLVASLNSANGPGDVGAVFGFMKSLDPQSVVKEGEFALAAKSAGVWESFKNIPANKLEGTILTEKQRKDFGKLAFEYIKSKGKLYDVKYNDLTKVLKQQNIPQSYYPTKMTDLINMYDKPTESQASGITASNGKDYTSYFTK